MNSLCFKLDGISYKIIFIFEISTKIKDYLVLLKNDHENAVTLYSSKQGSPIWERTTKKLTLLKQGT